MPTFTRPDGSSIIIDAAKLVRARSSFDWEIAAPAGPDPTSILSPLQVVTEAISDVGEAMKAERPSWIFLTGLAGRALWFDAKKAGDARAPYAIEAQPGVNAVVPIDGVALKVTETIAEAQAAIVAARTLV